MPFYKFSNFLQQLFSRRSLQGAQLPNCAWRESVPEAGGAEKSLCKTSNRSVMQYRII